MMGQIVGILLGSIALVIFALVYKARRDAKKLRRKLEDRIEEVAQQNQLTWTTTDVSKHRAFAWAADRHILFFMDFSTEEGRMHIIDMAHVLTCNIVERSTSGGGSRNDADRQVSKVELEICFKDKSCIYLPMYSEMEDGVLEKIRLTNKARHWKELIQPKRKDL